MSASRSWVAVAAVVALLIRLLLPAPALAHDPAATALDQATTQCGFGPHGHALPGGEHCPLCAMPASLTPRLIAPPLPRLAELRDAEREAALRGPRVRATVAYESRAPPV